MSSTNPAQTLPSELLKLIFVEASNSTIPEERPCAALTLSHVCSSFRRVALVCPKLWTTLSRKLGRPGLELIEACIQRSADQPLDVLLYLYGLRGDFGGSRFADQVAVDRMAKTVLPVCSRWRSFAVHLAIIDPFDDCQWQNVILLTEFRQLSAKLDVPMLETFSIEEDADRSGLVPASSLLHLHPLLSSNPDLCWSLPALHTLTVQNAHVSDIPSGFRSPIRSASIRYIQRDLLYHLNTLRALAVASSLTTLHLSFQDCKFSRKFPDPTISEISHVRSLHIDFLGCSQLHWSEHNLWKAFRTFRFPDVRVVDVKIILDIGDGSFVLWDGLQALDITLHSFLVTDQDVENPCPFPQIETLDIDVRLRRGDGIGLALLLPQCCLPSLKHLRIRSSFNLILLGDVGKFDEATLPRHFAIGGVNVPIALKTLILDIPRVDGVVMWLRELVAKMQAQRCWSGFAELILKNGGRDIQIVHRDEVEGWCEMVTSIDDDSV
ncbi:hypothetical protein SCHPADRAFT_936398 [Schizopora paradoxa]|uniref:Uncharacterized protein n=1 Tax=Schizopora paradoxa TaxID=27342 RepID=A0A0H2S2P4_9AGAM|nr:hypothetical protein SCHPADRAFT_936398 [Schizopora paradoxa]